MKNKFISGLLTGILSSMILFLVVFGVRQYALYGSENNAGQSNSTTDGNTNTSDSFSDLKDDVLKKITMLEGYIDNYYLNETDSEKLVDGIYKGVLASLEDPYSTYYTKKEFTALQEASSGVYCGIGATVSQSYETGIITIVKPFVSGPAYNAGILPGDVLYKVAGEEVTGKDLSEVTTKMKGEAGTKVKVEVVREGEKETREFEIERQKIEIPSIEYKLLDGKIGYIAISEFDDMTVKQYRNALDALEKQGMEGLIVDLRDNGGGVLASVVDMLDRMLPEGMIVYTKDKNGKGKEYTSTNKEKFEKPLAVLINGNSASASEVYAGAIQDYGVGTLVGTKSFGKGIVQSVIPLVDGTAIKLTTSTYYTPKGRNIHEKGIEPDVEIELDEKLRKKVVIEEKDDNQLQKAIEIVKDKMNKE